jgi:threonine aldolase
MKNVIDLRSDTVTKPSRKMREAMARAEVGDDVFGEDPTVNLLQQKVARMFGMESALFIMSGTMGNQLAIRSHTKPGNEVICEEGAHCYNFESGAAGMLSGVQMHPLLGKNGVITADQIEAVIRPKNYWYPQTALICIENTHNRAGGTIFPIEEIKKIKRIGKKYNLRMHLDGARLFHAVVETGISPKEYAKFFDSVTFCFSKGLGAPIGSILIGSEKFINQSHYFRKAQGGGTRQLGILAAAALYALEHNIERLKEDHHHARQIAEAFTSLPGFESIAPVQTNIVIIDVAKSKKKISDVIQKLKNKNVLVTQFGPTRLRAVTHLDISSDQINQVVRVVKNLFK